METREILEKLKKGELTLEEAEGALRRQPFEDLGYAKLDTHRKIRSGFPGSRVLCGESRCASPCDLWQAV